MALSKAPTSNWIDSIGYIPGFLAIFRRDGVALLYSGKDGHPIPSYLPGLVLAGTGRRSPGLAYNRLIKGKPDAFTYQAVNDPSQVAELKEMMK